MQGSNARQRRFDEQAVRKPEYYENTKQQERPVKQIALVNMDYTLLITTILLTVFGLVMVYSSSYYTAATSSDYDSMFDIVRTQIVAAIIGVAAMLIVSNFSYHKHLRKFTVLVYGAAVVLLIATILKGESSGGAQRWIRLPVLGRFQPSELAKIAIIMSVSHIIAYKKDMADNIPGLIKLAVVIGLLAALIGVGTNNMSSAIIIAIIGFGIIFVASSKTMPFVVLGGLAVAALIFILATGTGFRSERFTAWQDPFSDPTDTGFQTVQSLYAIGSGGMFGLGLGQSRQKLGFIPEAHNDIIFSVICEELGFFGAILVLFLFGVYLWRAIKIALNAKDLYGCLLATGVALMVGSQALINIAVVTNTIPNTGVPLPFISHGGTSLDVMLFCTGILLNISRYQKVN